MFKKLTALLLAFSVIFGFAGCVKEHVKNQDKIVPYMSGYKYDEENGYWTEKLYGLMTTDGKAVIEPVYNEYQTFEQNGKNFYCLKVMEGDWEPICHNSLLISSDGKFRLELKDNIVCLSENRIICQQFDEPFTVYDYNGNKIFSGNKNQSVDTNGNGFYNGLLVVYDFMSEENYMEIMDENGKAVLNRFDYCGPFITGKAVASYNRDEGYGIISADGKWLLDPVYDDIQTVGGKYFIAVDNGREYIYDSDMKLLRERECGIYIAHGIYYFELNSKLIRYYSYIDAPDYFYRDAFTDEIISCNGINMSMYSEYFSLFYHIDQAARTVTICDENGKLLAEYKNADKFVEHEGTYCIGDNESGKHTYFDAKTHEQVLTLSNVKYAWKPVNTAGDCELLSVADLEHKSGNIYDGPYHLYDYNKGEYVFRDCEYCEINDFGGNVYVTVVYKDRIETYDSDLNLLLKTENICEEIRKAK